MTYGTGDFGASNVIREHMRALRRILEGSRYLIENYRGIGYELIVADLLVRSRNTD